MLKYVLLVGWCLAQATMGQVLVKSPGEFSKAVTSAVEGETIVVEDGVYSDINLSVTTAKLTIKAKHPGRAIISGDSSVVLDGEGILFSGFYFRDGRRDPSEWSSHGPGIVTVRGSRIRVTECAFHQFDAADGGWITVTPMPDGTVPEYVRIDHCSFTDKPTFDQVVNFNNCDRKLFNKFYETVDGAPGAPPMYHRLDHCYFSNPPKKGNAGGGVRIGTWRNDIGRCLVDHNVFERQDSEAEIITSKSQENIFYNNTHLNCRGTMNFRHGDKQYLIRNWFLGTDELFDYGGLFIWGSDHGVVGNYFNLPRTRKSRGEACIYLNAGPRSSEFARADDSIIANNIIIADKGSLFDTAALLTRRIPWSKEKFGLEDVNELFPRGNWIAGNVMKVSEPTYVPLKGEAAKLQRYEGNLLSAASKEQLPKGIKPFNFDIEIGAYGLPMPPANLIKQTHVSVALNVDAHLPVDPNGLIEGEVKMLSASPKIDLDGLTDPCRPLTFSEVGPSWLKENPSSFSATGKVDGHLLELMKQTHKTRNMNYE